MVRDFKKDIFILDAACTDPPLPPVQANLELIDYEPGQKVAFGDSVAYECKDGHYFESDIEKQNLTLQCLGTGSFEMPQSQWEKCAHPKSLYFSALKHPAGNSAVFWIESQAFKLKLLCQNRAVSAINYPVCVYVETQHNSATNFLQNGSVQTLNHPQTMGDSITGIQCLQIQLCMAQC